MTVSPSRLLVLSITLALAACETAVPTAPSSAPSTAPSAAPATAAAAPAEAEKPEAAKPAPPAATEPAHAPVAAAAPRQTSPVEYTQYPPDTPKPGEIAKFQSVGNVACDSYADAVRACLNSGVVKGREKLALRMSLDHQLDAWRGKADTEACVQARAEMREKLKPYGCSGI